MREQDGQDRGETERESNERDSVIGGAIMGLAGNLALGKFPEIISTSSVAGPKSFKELDLQ